MTDPDRAWLITYLQHLPPELRPDRMAEDPLLCTAAQQARRNGWEPKAMAEAVPQRDYTGVTNPPLMAAHRLQAISSIPPAPTSDPPHWQAGEYIDAHCGRHGCGCLHRDGCYKGWLDDIVPNATVPCRVCRPVLWQRLRDIPEPGHRTAADLEHIRTHRQRG
jgi:hypothetical protein